MAKEFKPEQVDQTLRHYEVLYDRCDAAAKSSTHGGRKTFDANEMLELCKAPPLDYVTGMDKLTKLIQELSKHHQIITIKTATQLNWALRPKAAARQLQSLDTTERMVYTTIEEVRETGIWSKNIKRKLHLNDQRTLDKVLEKLQKSNLIKGVKNIKAPTQKTFMLAHLAPSDEVTGGSFYDSGELDEGLVEEISNLIVFHVSRFSWVEAKRPRRVKKEASPSAVAGAPDDRNKKRKRTGDIEDSAPARKDRAASPTSTGPLRFAHPAGHSYPSTADIHEFIVSGGYIRPVKAATITVDEIQALISVLVWDDKLEEVNGGYRTVRDVEVGGGSGMGGVPGSAFGDGMEDGRGNGLTEAPCGRCPVVDLCGPGGPVNAGSCVYYARWLSMGVGVAE